MDPGSAPQVSKGAGGGSLRRDSRRIAETLLIGAIGGIIFCRAVSGGMAGGTDGVLRILAL